MLKKPNPIIQTNGFSKSVALLFLILASTIALLLLWEWFKFAVVKDPIEIASYLFGSEVMVNEGGEGYATADSYARSSLWEALANIPGIAGLWLAVKRNKATTTWLALVFWLVTVNLLTKLL